MFDRPRVGEIIGSGTPSRRKAVFRGASILSLPVALLLSGTALSAADYEVMSHGVVIGSMKVDAAADGGTVIDYGYANNGRGPRFRTAVRLDAAGRPEAMKIDGVNLLQVGNSETLTSAAGQLSWSTMVDQGKAATGGFYVPLNNSPEMIAMLTRALLRTASHSLPLLPGGKATLREADVQTVSANGATKQVTLYLVDGLQIGTTPIWLDEQGTFFAQIQGSSVIPGSIAKGWNAVFDQLQAAQTRVLDQRDREIAAELARKPGHPVVFRHVNLFDSETRQLRKDMRVVVSGERIVSVARDGTAALPAGAETIDGRGKTLLPGLWDMHVHIQSTIDGALHIANGVTSARDMGNVMSTMAVWHRDFDAGTVIGPRLMLAGLADGRTATSNNASVKVTNEAELDAAVKLFADAGYSELKIYSSFPPALVPRAVKAAHDHGMRAGGHVPAGMRLDDVVASGFDDVSHMNFLLLNFFGEDIQKKTNTLSRMLIPAEEGANIDVHSPAVAATVKAMHDRGVVLDATAIVLELLFTSYKGEVPDYARPYAKRLPPQLLRDTMSGGLATTPEQRALYTRSFLKGLDLLKRLHDGGVSIVPGTDGLAGLCIVRELELYAKAGIAVPDVLQMATLGPARMMKRDAELGSIVPGKLADLILVDGDPTRDLARLRDLDLVVKGGVMYDPRAVGEAIGIGAR